LTTLVLYVMVSNKGGDAIVKARKGEIKGNLTETKK